MGLVSRVLPDAQALRKVALELATDIASKSPVAVFGTKVRPGLHVLGREWPFPRAALLVQADHFGLL